MSRGRRSHDSDREGSSLKPPKLARTRYFTRSRSKRDALLGRSQQGRTNKVTDEHFLSRMDVLKPTPDVPSKALAVKSVDFHKEANARTHNTSLFEIDTLVVRRGQDFFLTIDFDRQINLEADVVLVQFVFGNLPLENKGTLLRMRLDLKTKTIVKSVVGNWTAKAGDVKGSSLTVYITPPANALVGKYGSFVETKLVNDKTPPRVFELDDYDIYVLFNAWCPDDVVYMDSEPERDEYVLSDHGRIWVGTQWNNRGRPWNFGQFDNPVLEAALFLMDREEVGDNARRSPVTFVRTISSQANSMDNEGVLAGRWAEDFPKPCTLPWSWMGSVKIIEKFMKDDKSVLYGQCWVFSGVVTSLLRALGIPTRSVTNFASAHDGDGSMTIDSYFDEDDEPDTAMNDSVWNFHVWNESFFRRTDLPEGYGGWQAHDSTPQEQSEGIMRCGPAPLRAIKEGEVYLNYDVGFIFSEVNGDRVTWKMGKRGEMEVINVDSTSVGKCISTKAVGSDLRMDITRLYKYPEGSEDERRVVAYVNRFSSTNIYDIYDNKVVKDVKFSIVLPQDAAIGDTFKAGVRIQNTAAAPRSLYGRLTVLSTYYTGVPGKRLMGKHFKQQVPAGSAIEFFIELTPDDYLTRLNPEASMQLFASFHSEETGQTFAKSEEFILGTPFLDITLQDKAVAKKTSKIVVTFTNPLKTSLTNGVVNVEGAAISSDNEFVYSGPIKPGEVTQCTFDIRPRRACHQRRIQATFTSDQLCGVDGSLDFKVEPAQE